jgi:hypothetical protein
MKAMHFTFILVVLFMLNFISCDSNEKEVCSDVNCSDSEVCIEGECFDTLCLDTICYVCGDFVGEMNGNIETVFDDTTFSNLPANLVVSDLASFCSYKVSFDISSLLGAQNGTLVPEVEGSFSDSTIIITDQVYLYQGIAAITINGFVNYSSDFNNVNGSLNLTGEARGAVTFDGVRQ